MAAELGADQEAGPGEEHIHKVPGQVQAAGGNTMPGVLVVVPEVVVLGEEDSNQRHLTPVPLHSEGDFLGLVVHQGAGHIAVLEAFRA